jgi:hypothetical protein
MMDEIDNLLHECTTRHIAKKLEDILREIKRANRGWDVVPIFNSFTTGSTPRDKPWTEPELPTEDEIEEHGLVYLVLRMPDGRRTAVFQALDLLEETGAATPEIGSLLIYEAENGVDAGFLQAVYPCTELQSGVPEAPFTRALRVGGAEARVRLVEKQKRQNELLSCIKSSFKQIHAVRVEFQYDYKRVVLFCKDERAYVDYKVFVESVRMFCHRGWCAKYRPRVYVHRRGALCL